MSIDDFGEHVRLIKRDPHELCDVLEKALRRVDDATLPEWPRVVAARFVCVAVPLLHRNSAEAVHWSQERRRCDELSSRGSFDTEFAKKFCEAYGAQLCAQWQDAWDHFFASNSATADKDEKRCAWCGAAAVWPKMADRPVVDSFVKVGERCLAVDNDGERAAILTLLGRIAHVSRNFELAEKRLRDANSLRPGDTGTLRFLADVLLDDRHNGRLFEACALLEQVRDAHKENVDVLMDLADAHGKCALANKDAKARHNKEVVELVRTITQLVCHKSIVGRRSHIYARCARILMHGGGLPSTGPVVELIEAGLAAVLPHDNKRVELMISLNKAGFQLFRKQLLAPVAFVKDSRALKYAWGMVRAAGDSDDPRVVECALFIKEQCRLRNEHWDEFAKLPQARFTPRWMPHVDLAELTIWREFRPESVLNGRIPLNSKARTPKAEANLLEHVNRAVGGAVTDRCTHSDVARLLSFVDGSVKVPPALAHGVAAYRRLWGATKGRLLYRADYEQNNTPTDGIRAKNPKDTKYTAEQHVADGSLKTRFVSFTTALPVALMHWARAKNSKPPTRRHLVAVDPTHYLFRVSEVTEHSELPRGKAQAQATADREIVVSFASDSLPLSAIDRDYDVEECIADNITFAKLISATRASGSYKFFATNLLDREQVEALLETYSRERFR